MTVYKLKQWLAKSHILFSFGIQERWLVIFFMNLSLLLFYSHPLEAARSIIPPNQLHCTSISDAVQIDAAIDDVGDTDCYTFEAAASDIISAYIANETNGGTRRVEISLLKPDGSELNSEKSSVTGFDVSIVHQTLPDQGTYTLIVAGDEIGLIDSIGPYTLYFSDLSADTSAINDGQIINGGIDFPGDADAFRFEGNSHDIITAYVNNMTTTGDKWIEIIILKPDGLELVSDKSLTTNEDVLIQDEILAEAGSYTIIVMAASGIPGSAATTGPYTLFFSNLGDDLTPISNDQTINGTIDFPGEADAYTFLGCPGDHVSITVDNLTTEGIRFVKVFLNQPDHITLEADTSIYSGDDVGILDEEIPMWGIYTIVVRGYELVGADHTMGPYTINFSYDDTPPLCLDSPFVQVKNEDGFLENDVEVYINDTFLGTTDDQGQVFLKGPLVLGDTIVTMLPMAELPTIRAEHNGWAYRTYTTNIGVDPVGEVQAFTLSAIGETPTLTVRPKNTLTLFNIVVSIEWDASEAYLADVEQAMYKAADFLYDVTDGQMTFGEVAIYDSAEHWAEADIQISAKNIVHPHAHIGGIFDRDLAHRIRLGRQWDGRTGDQGDWSAPNGYRTIVHEFGHYGLGLYDEYFGYEIVDGDLAGTYDSHCTGPENRMGGSDASIMDYHYDDPSELADRGRWTGDCQETAQHQLNNGEADWETLVRLFSDPSGQELWELVTPDQRAGFGQTVPGPTEIPEAFPFPIVSYTNVSLDDPTPVPLTVCHNALRYDAGAWVTLYYGGKAMDQGLTNVQGIIDILGAQPGDTVNIIAQDGSLSASAILPLSGPVHLTANSSSLMAQTTGSPGPYLRLWPTVDVANSLDGIRFVVAGTTEHDGLNYALTGPDKIGPTDTIPYDAGEKAHQIKVGFVPDSQTGFAKLNGSYKGQAFNNINIDYRLHQTTNLSDTNLFSNDGNFKLHLQPGSLPLDDVTFLIASPWGLPAALPDGLDIIGEAYEITASNNVEDFTKSTVLSLRYDPTALHGFEDLAIHRWDFATSTWQNLGGTLDSDHQELSISTDKLGLYALLGKPKHASIEAAGQSGVAQAVCQAVGEIYLPLVMK